MNIGGGLPVRQSRQLPKARHVEEARLLRKLDFSHIVSACVKRKARILSSIPSIICFVFMLDVLVFVKQHKLVQYIVWIESIFLHISA